MAEKPYALTERDAERLREMYAAHKNHAPPTRPRDTRADDEEWLGPECYVALTPAAGTGTGTGSGAPGGIPARIGLTPGAATCDVFRLVGDDLYGPLFTEDVRNLSTAAVAADSWVIIQRDKSGTWWVAWTDVTGSGVDGGCRYEVRAGAVCLSTTVTDTVGTGSGTGSPGGGGSAGCDGYRQPVNAFTDSGAGGAAWTGCTGGGTHCDNVLDCGDSSYAGIMLDALTVSNPLVTYYNFAVLSTIPPTAPVGGILVDVSCLFDFGNGHSPTQTWTLTAQLVLGGIAVGTPKSVDLLPAVTGLVLGGASDTWGRAWTQSEVKDPTFGVALALTVPSVDAQGKLLVNCTTLAVCWPAGSGSGGGGIVTIPPAITGGASTTVSLVQRYELIDRQAPCGTPNVLDSWCVRNASDCCGPPARSLTLPCCPDPVPGLVWLVFGETTLVDVVDGGSLSGRGYQLGMTCYVDLDDQSLNRSQCYQDDLESIYTVGCTAPDGTLTPGCCAYWIEGRPSCGTLAQNGNVLRRADLVLCSGASLGSGSPYYRKRLWTLLFNSQLDPTGGGTMRDLFGNSSITASTPGSPSGGHQPGVLMMYQDRSASCAGPVLAEWTNVAVTPDVGMPHGQTGTISSIKIIRGAT